MVTQNNFVILCHCRQETDRMTIMIVCHCNRSRLYFKANFLTVAKPSSTVPKLRNEPPRLTSEFLSSPTLISSRVARVHLQGGCGWITQTKGQKSGIFEVPVLFYRATVLVWCKFLLTRNYHLHFGISSLIWNATLNFKSKKSRPVPDQNCHSVVVHEGRQNQEILLGKG